MERMTFEEYIIQLAEQHPAIRHSEVECHFSDLAEDAQNAYAHHTMHYPCVVLDELEAYFGGSEQQIFKTDRYSLLFLDHVRDTGDANEVRFTFHRMRRIALDFLRKMHRDIRNVKILSRFSVPGTELVRVYLQDAGLYGYALFIEHTTLFVDLDCEHIFDD